MANIHRSNARTNVAEGAVQVSASWAPGDSPRFSLTVPCERTAMGTYRAMHMDLSTTEALHVAQSISGTLSQFDKERDRLGLDRRSPAEKLRALADRLERGDFE